MYLCFDFGCKRVVLSLSLVGSVIGCFFCFYNLIYLNCVVALYFSNRSVHIFLSN